MGFRKLKKSMINDNFLDNDNLKSFKITKILVDGYYKDAEEREYMQVDFTDSCHDNSKTCVNNCHYYEEDNEFTKWIITDENTIFEFIDGISINANDIDSGKFIFGHEEIK